MLYTKDFWYYLLSFLGIACALGLHEYVKARVSFRQGDPMPKLSGRLRANPFSHLDPLGVAAMLLTGFGWARPAPASASYYADRRMGTLITHIIPILVNIVAACAAAALLTVYKTFLLSSATLPFEGMWRVNFEIYRTIYFFARANLAVALFNILPIYPLDGNAVLEAFLTPNKALKLKALEKLTQLILLFLLAVGIISAAFEPVIKAILGFVII